MSTPTRASGDVLAGFREGFECWNGGRLDEMAEMYREDAELDTTEAFPGGSKMFTDEAAALAAAGES